MKRKNLTEAFMRIQIEKKPSLVSPVSVLQVTVTPTDKPVTPF